eukprot:CAMPEP_0114588344 /NCGR_PEP_ID=MMETSP0125-20121206/11066_1 /TAXON_ID=485358 ORGANISM="Aristerostoma sp., Strain ATCC 50986" /NCGR_SAMPLE_ID=MMETSP0125 /ASSEMBLY_ACC=CAM_ASM_000245 /LENGTH=113 /DNA_ID=CAMNT_0001784685 /DNA_START=172 /DNA_END=510 /DNA_ORIENTATION=+
MLNLSLFHLLFSDESAEDGKGGLDKDSEFVSLDLTVIGGVDKLEDFVDFFLVEGFQTKLGTDVQEDTFEFFEVDVATLVGVVDVESGVADEVESGTVSKDVLELLLSNELHMW